MRRRYLRSPTPHLEHEQLGVRLLVYRGEVLLGEVIHREAYNLWDGITFVDEVNHIGNIRTGFPSRTAAADWVEIGEEESGR